ncbi:8264_t:CDS:2, partial [Acaulospora morrowiae]
KRRNDPNTPYSQSPGHKYNNNTERNEYVGITISDDFSQKQLPSMPVMVTSSSPSRSHHQPQNPHRQDFLDGHNRRRSINYIQSSSGHYPVVPSSQNQNSSQHQRSLSGTHQQSHQHLPSSHLLQQSHKQPSLPPSITTIRQHQRPMHNNANQQQPHPTIQCQLAPIQSTYQTAYSNSQSPSPNPFPNIPNSNISTHNKPSQSSSLTTRDNVSKPEFGGTVFQRIRSKSDLRPQPASRRKDSAKGSVSPLKALTVYLTSTYHNINPNFRYELSHNPRRVLTKPSKGVKNDGYDNEDNDYILYVNDILGSEEGQKYLILDILGQGTFGQVVKCQNLKTKEMVAVKVVKNKPAYFNQSMMEVTILELLNNTWDKHDQHHILRLLDTFIHRRHLCLVFELLSVNLYELIKQNQFRGLSTNLVRVFTAQLLDALTVLNEARIIHCDLKPENVLLKNLESPTIKVIDFGSACHERQTVYTYIQSRFYRSPEVLLGLPYSSSIDMWSLGCIAAELFLGLPLFPGSSEYNQVSRIVEMLGVPPPYMIEVGKTEHEYFDRYINEHGQKKYRLKTMEQYMKDNNCVEQPSKRYFSATTLPEIIKSYPIMRKGVTQKDIEKEMQSRLAFIDFIQGLLNLNPIERWSPQQAKLHPFITGEKFNGKFVPPMQLKSPSKVSVSSVPTLNSSSTTSQSSTSNLSSMPSPSQYKTKATTSPKLQHKNVITSHEMPSVTVTSHVTNSKGPITSQRPQIQQTLGKSSTLTPKSSSGSLRPRASTIGNIQVPPQIQRAAALVTPGSVGASPGEYSRLPREKDLRRLPQHYPHLQLLKGQDQMHDVHQFSVVVEGDDRRAPGPSSNLNAPTNEAVDIRIEEDWNAKGEKHQKEEGSPKDDRQKNGMTDEICLSNNDPANNGSINNNSNEKRLKVRTKMPGSMPNGVVKSQNNHHHNNSWQSSSKSQRSVLPQHHYQQPGLRHPSPLSTVSVSVVSPTVNQTSTRAPTYRSSPSYNPPSSSFRTPSTSPYANQTQGSHQLVLPPPVTQQAPSITTPGSYYQNLVPQSYEQYHHNTRTLRQPFYHRISPSTSPSYPPSSPSNHDLPPSPTLIQHLPSQSSFFQPQPIMNNLHSSPKIGPHATSQQSSFQSITNTTVNSDALPHLNNDHDTKYNNRREINAMPYQMA